MDGPVCSQCQATSSLIWHKKEDGSILCLDCRNNEKPTAESQPVPQPTNKTCTSEKNAKENSNSSNSSETSETSGQNGASVTATGNSNASNSHGRRTRLRERTARGKQAGRGAETTRSKGAAPQPSQPSGTGSNGGGKASQQKASSSSGGRRQLKQSRPQKAPKPRSTIVTSDSVTHKGTVYEVGDIASMLDKDGGTYYAIIRGFLQDQYAEKYAVLMWLLPVYPNPTHFDPAAFILGPEEDVPRSMELLDFVCHSPQSRHFQASYFHSIPQAETWKGPLLPTTPHQES